MKGLLKFTAIILILAGLLYLIYSAASGKDPLAEIKSIFSSLSNPVVETEETLDTTPLEAELYKTEVQTYSSTALAVITANKEIELEERANTKLFLSKVEESKYWYVLEIKNTGIGTAVPKFLVKDKSGRGLEFNLKVTRLEANLPFGLKEIEDWPDAAYTADGDNLLAKVDKKHKLVPGYVPLDLFTLFEDKSFIVNKADISLRTEAKDALKIMLTDLLEQTGQSVIIASGFRTYEDQYNLYSGYLRTYTQEETDQFSARPGFSEHHLGTVVDFTSKDVNYELTNDFNKTGAGSWLLQNSYKYGYLQTYPEGKESVTGYNHEAWHYRYIGRESAKDVFESGLTLNEWLGKF